MRIAKAHIFSGRTRHRVARRADGFAGDEPDAVNSSPVADATGPGRRAYRWGRALLLPEPPPAVARALPRRRVARCYVLAVSIVGLAALALFAAGAASQFREDLRTYWFFLALILLAEMVPITVPRRDGAEEISTSTAFSVALMMLWGTGPAVVATVGASTLADLVHRKPHWKVTSNAGQYAISTGMAGVVYRALGGGTFHSGHQFLPFLAAAAIRFALSDVITGMRSALAKGTPIIGDLGSDLGFRAAVASALYSLAPGVVVLAQRSLPLVLLLVLPLAAVYLATSNALANVRLVRRLEEALDQSRELNRLKDEFVAVVSHELRTPLTCIQGYIKTLLRPDATWGDHQRREFLVVADRQSTELRRRIEELLLVSRLDAGLEEGVLRVVSAADLVRDVLAALRPLTGKRQVRVSVDGLLPPVQSDPAKLAQILTNLVENAIKYSPDDSMVRVGGRAQDGGLTISVKDQGPGIPPGKQPKIFDRFYQVDQSPTRSVGGMGLGLYICAELAKAIGARTWLERSDHRGSVFCVWVPFAQPIEDERMGTRSSPAVHSSAKALVA